jgi:hypothetical protein
MPMNPIARNRVPTKTNIILFTLSGTPIVLSLSRGKKGGFSITDWTGALLLRCPTPVLQPPWHRIPHGPCRRGPPDRAGSPSWPRRGGLLCSLRGGHGRARALPVEVGEFLDEMHVLQQYGPGRARRDAVLVTVDGRAKVSGHLLFFFHFSRTSELGRNAGSNIHLSKRIQPLIMNYLILN